MSFWGKLHEITLYGLIASIICLCLHKISFPAFFCSIIAVNSFSTFFQIFLLCASILFFPIAIIGAFVTKQKDQGEGLLFHSNHIIVIVFAHLAEELIGIIMTPIWFIKDLFNRNLSGFWKIFDYMTYLIEVVFIIVGVIIL